MTIDGVPRKSGSEKCLAILKNNVILILMVIGVGLGIACGIGLREVKPALTERQIFLIKFPGDLLIRALQLLVLPLIVSTLVSGVASLGTMSAKVGLRTIVFYLVTTIIAMLLGIGLVAAIRPGIGREWTQTTADVLDISTVDAILDVFRNLIPDNIIQVAFIKARTAVSIQNVNNSSNETVIIRDIEMLDGFNILGLVTVSIGFGVVINNMGDKAKPLRELCDCLADATLRLANFVIWGAPVGVAFLIAGDVIEMPDPVEVVRQMGLYIACVMLGMGIQMFVVLPIMYVIVCRKNPIVFIFNMVQSYFTVCGTTSSAATIPVTYYCLEEKNGVDARVSRFVVPVGATMNMNGSALYEAVASLFIAQLSGYDLNFGRMLIISFTATVASIGAAGVPQGIVSLINALTALGLPKEELAKLLAIDWLLDRIRDITSITGDAFGAAIVAKLSEQDLMQDQRTEDSDLDVSEAFPDEDPKHLTVEENLTNGDIDGIHKTV